MWNKVVVHLVEVEWARDQWQQLAELSGYRQGETERTSESGSSKYDYVVLSGHLSVAAWCGWSQVYVTQVSALITSCPWSLLSLSISSLKGLIHSDLGKLEGLD